MEKMIADILDVHTHRLEEEFRRKAIINYPLSHSLGKAGKTQNESIEEEAFAQFTLPSRNFYSLGIHPWTLDVANAALLLERLRQLLDKHSFVAIGEVGIDKMAAAPISLQIEMFEEQVLLSEQYQLPLVIHGVKAMGEILAVKKRLAPEQPWIWHGFRGKPQQAEQLMDKGFYLSFGAYYAEETVCMMPTDRMFLETDDRPISIEEVLHQIAATRGEEEETLQVVIRENIQNVFFKR